MLKFSLSEFLLFMISVSLCLAWGAHRPKPFELPNFSIKAVESNLNKRIPFAVLCVPEMFQNMPLVDDEITTDLLHKINAKELAIYRHDYPYWSRPPGDWGPETKWVVEYGAGKEPSIILVDGNRRIENLPGIRFWYDSIAEYFGLEIDQSKPRMYMTLFVFSSVLTILFVVGKRKLNNRRPGIDFPS